jgi:RNA polymerase sigma-70 factor, ECF subfamily
LFHIRPLRFAVTLSSPSRDGVSFGCVLKAWEAHEAELLGFLRHQAGDPHRAEDLLQEVFLKAMRQGQGFCDLLQPRAWLFQVARNALIDEARRRRPTVELSDDVPAASTEEGLPVDELAECVERTLPRLEPDDQDVIRCCDVEGWRQHEYADSALQFFFYDTPKVLLLLTGVVFVMGMSTPTSRRSARARCWPAAAKGRQRDGGQLGIVTPFCSCSAVPLFIGFVQAGVPLGVTLLVPDRGADGQRGRAGLLFGLFGWKIARCTWAWG